MYQDSLSPTASILVIQHPDRPGLSKALNVAKRSAVVEEIEKEGQRKITRTPAIGSTRDVGTSSGLNSFYLSFFQFLVNYMQYILVLYDFSRFCYKGDGVVSSRRDCS
jgi:hypothetical protein